MKEGKKIMVAADRRKEKSRKVEREIEKSRGGKIIRTRIPRCVIPPASGIYLRNKKLIPM